VLSALYRASPAALVIGAVVFQVAALPLLWMTVASKPGKTGE
jgi:hypothetical protein